MSVAGKPADALARALSDLADVATEQVSKRFVATAPPEMAQAMVAINEALRHGRAALDALLAELAAAQRERSVACEWAAELAGAKRQAESERDQARDALAHFANPQHWAIRRDGDPPSVVWIGTYRESPVDLARAALGGAAKEET